MDARKMHKNNTTIMFGVLFSSMILLPTVTILQQQNAHARPIKTNFGNGYADGKHAAQSTFHNTTWAELSSGNNR
jgi:hypothetical protein